MNEETLRDLTDAMRLTFLVITALFWVPPVLFVWSLCHLIGAARQFDRAWEATWRLASGEEWPW